MIEHVNHGSPQKGRPVIIATLPERSGSCGGGMAGKRGGGNGEQRICNIGHVKRLEIHFDLYYVKLYLEMQFVENEMHVINSKTRISQPLALKNLDYDLWSTLSLCLQ